MKLGHVERQLDGKKMTFHFTARAGWISVIWSRPDRAVHTRVELRQIGARDDAGMQGGCGVCGRVQCCVDWIRGFDPVSIKMAKNQGLSLNPAKISGICGRLMCCLKFEYDPQSAKRGRAPAPPAAGPDADGPTPIVPSAPRRSPRAGGRVPSG